MLNKLLNVALEKSFTIIFRSSLQLLSYLLGGRWFFFSFSFAYFFCDFRVVGVEVLKGTGKSEFKSFDPNAAQPLVGEVVAFLFGELE